MYTYIYLITKAEYGGTQFYTVELANHASSLSDTVIILSPECYSLYKIYLMDKVSPILVNQIILNFFHSKNYFFRIIPILFLFFYFIKSQKKVLSKRIIFHSSLNPISFFLMNLLLRPKCAVNTFHDFGMINKKSISYNLNSFLLGLQKNNKYITPSENVKNLLIKYIASIDVNKIKVINTGISITNNKSFSSFKRHSKKIGMLGRLDYVKNPFFWIEVAKKITAKYENVEFIWVGQGNLYSELSKNSHKRISFLGHVEDKNQFLDKVDILFFTSLWEGGCMPRTILEAMNRKIPCVVPNLPTLIESLEQSNDTALIYRNNSIDAAFNALEKIIINESLSQSIASNALKHIKKNHDLNTEINLTFFEYTI